MSLWKIALRSIQQRALASTLTGLSMALGVALVVAVLVLYGAISRSFVQGAEGFDMIVGAKGSRLQLVLNTVFHLSSPVENIPWSYYEEFQPGGKFGKQVQVAVPLCLGDNYHDFRVVGTTPKLFEVEYAPARKYAFAAGRNFEHEHYFEAVIGSVAAHSTGLRVGSEFAPSHGVEGDAGHKHDPFQVVGVLAPTGTPNDRAVFVNMEGFYLLEGHAKAEEAGSKTAAVKGAPADGKDHDHEHAHEHREPLPKSQREVTAVLVRSTNALWNPYLFKAINKGQYAQAVSPAVEVHYLFQGIVGNLETLLLVLAVLIVFVAGIGVMVSIYNSMSERRREIAVMRALGANRQTVLAIVLLESILLAAGGGLIGMVLGHAMLGVLGPWVSANTGVSLGFFQFAGDELVLIPGLVVLATLAGLLPAVSAYRTDVAKALAAAP